MGHSVRGPWFETALARLLTMRFAVELAFIATTQTLQVARMTR
jgi:hypothetical protein